MYLSKNNYDELKELIITTHPRSLGQILKHKYPTYLSFLRDRFNFLNNPATSQLCYHFINDINENVKCSSCNKLVKFRSITEGYKKFCSASCSMKGEGLEKYMKSHLDKFDSLEEHLAFLHKHKIIRKQTWMKLVKKYKVNLSPMPWKYFKEFNFLDCTESNYEDHLKLIEKYKIKSAKEWSKRYSDIMINENVRLLCKLAIFKEYDNFKVFGEYALTEEQKSSYKKYRNAVRIITWRNIKLYGKEYFGKNWKKYYNDNNVHIDHIVSIKYGFDNKIDGDIIGNIKNLRIIDAAVNLSKGKKCDMTINELLNKINI